MKKAVSIMLFFALFLLLAGCKEVPVSESSEPLNSNNVIKWFDCLNGMKWLGMALKSMIWTNFQELLFAGIQSD